MLQPLTKSETLSTGQVPVAVYINGIPHWQAQNGRTFPLVAGGEDDPPGDPENDDDEQADDFDKDRALATIRKLREKEKADKAALKLAREQVAAAEKKDKERQDADKSELEKAQARLAELDAAHKEAEAKLQRVLVAQAIERAAIKQNARNPEVVAKLIDHSDLELDDSGAPTNADELVKALLKAEPYLIAAEQSGESRPNGSGVPATPRSSGQPGHAEKQKVAGEKLALSGNYAEL